MEKFKNFMVVFRSIYVKSDISSNSAKISYFMIFAIFPFIITLLNIASFTMLSNEVILSNLSSVLPKEASNMLLGVIADINQSSSGLLLIFSILIGVWAASRGMLSLIQSINVAYQFKETRKFMKLNLVAIMLTLFVITTVLISLGFIVFSDFVNQFITTALHLHFSFIAIVNIIKYFILICVLIFVFTMLYTYSPNYEKEEKDKFKNAVPGAVFATSVWLIVAIFLGLYLNNFANYNKTYGSIGGVIVTLLWLNISASILLVGGVINASIRKIKADKVFD